MGDIVTLFGEMVQKECRKDPLAAALWVPGQEAAAHGHAWETHHKGGPDGSGSDHGFHDLAPGPSRAGGHGQLVPTL